MLSLEKTSVVYKTAMYPYLLITGWMDASLTECGRMGCNTVKAPILMLKARSEKVSGKKVHG